MQPIHVESNFWKIWIYCHCIPESPCSCRFSVSFWSMWLLGFLFVFITPFNISCGAGFGHVFFSFSVHPEISLFLHPFWMTVLLGKVFLAACSPHFIPWICSVSTFWLARSLWRGLMLFWCSLSVRKKSRPPTCSKYNFLGLRFASLSIACQSVLLFSLIWGGVFSASWTRKHISFSRLGKFSSDLLKYTF